VPANPLTVSQQTQPARRRRTTIIVLAIVSTLLFAALFIQQAFNLEGVISPDSNEQTFLFAALQGLIFVLFVLLSFVLLRTLLKLYAERRSGVFGSQIRTRMVVGSLMLSLLPIMFFFIFARGLMSRSIEKWFSRPVEEVRQDTAAVANLLTGYASADANNEAREIASSPDVQKAFTSGNFNYAMNEFRRHDPTLETGFALAIAGDIAEASYRAPDTWPALKSELAPQALTGSPPARPVKIRSHEYILGRAPVADRGYILVGLRLPQNFSGTLAQVERSQQQYLQLSSKRKQVQRFYMGQLLLLTVAVLFASTWFALFLSKFVTRPVVALAEATHQLSMGRYDYRIDFSARDELGALVASFNRMAEELESSRSQIEASSRELSDVNTALERRRRQIETILESTPTGVLSLDAERRVTHTNSALTRMFRMDMPEGATLDSLFAPEIADDLRHMIRKSNRMGTVTSQLEIHSADNVLNAAVTVASLTHDKQRLGYVLVFEDLSDLLRAQKQLAWQEVARRVAHEIKNPLTPISLSAERIRRHLERGVPPDDQSLAVIHGCAETIAGAVETVRTLVDEFSTLARFPAAQPQPANVNDIVQNALAMFDGRLEGVRIRTELAAGLPKAMADPAAITRVVANLVDNAAEAMQDTMLREVFISTALVGSKDTVEIVVADTGHGVTPEMKEKLFLPYFSTKRRGTGLGLAIVSRIIEDHRGSIRVEENKPVGARFIVELPVAPEAVTLSTHA
jgi:two-component system, NtrC family, nitrogen regulation sensor histidine kinase NtrY